MQVDIGITWLTIQHQRFKAVIESSTDHRWASLRNFVQYYSQYLRLRVSPLPFFGEGYSSSGSFPYYRELSLRLEKEYYVLSVDYTDSPVFWPLALHEIAHCWLSRGDDVDQICGAHLAHLGVDQETAASRVEEALCDSIATRIFGPAFPHAFLHKLWAQFPAQVSPDYPSNRYRIECMSSELDAAGFFEEAADLRETADRKFLDRWQDEETSWSLNDLHSVANQLSSPLAPEVRRLARSASKNLTLSTISDPPSLFYAAWIAVNVADPKDIVSATSRVSQEILHKLEGSTVSPDAHT